LSKNYYGLASTRHAVAPLLRNVRLFLRVLFFTSPQVALIVAFQVSVALGADVISTVAGTGAATNNGNEGIATSINVQDPFGVEIGPDGALYITEVGNHRVMRVDRVTGQLTTVAGSGRKGYSGDGRQATQAELNEPYEVRFDATGNMIFVEMQNHLIRRVEAKTGVISTVAGTGKPGFSGDGGPAVEATFNRPHSIALDEAGNLFIADIGNHRIRRVDAATGIVTTFAGNGAQQRPQPGKLTDAQPILGPRALAIDGQVMWIALREGHSVWRLDLSTRLREPIAGTGAKGYSGDGGPAARATFNGPKGIAVGPDGHLLVVDTENQAIRKIDVGTAVISTVAGQGPEHRGGGGDGGDATHAELARPHGICVDRAGVIYLGDTLNHRVRRIQKRTP